MGIKLYTRAQLFKGRLALNPRYFFLRSTAFSLIIFCAFFRASNHQLVDKKNKTEMLFKLSNLNSNHALTLGYLNPALNNATRPRDSLDYPNPEVMNDSLINPKIVVIATVIKVP